MSLAGEPDSLNRIVSRTPLWKLCRWNSTGMLGMRYFPLEHCHSEVNANVTPKRGLRSLFTIPRLPRH